jgi:hypothetical protein
MTKENLKVKNYNFLFEKKFFFLLTNLKPLFLLIKKFQYMKKINLFKNLFLRILKIFLLSLLNLIFL